MGRNRIYTEHYSDWVSLYSEGVSTREIADHYKCSSTAVTLAIRPFIKIRTQSEGQRRNTIEEALCLFAETKPSGCIEWTGGVNNKGYGTARIDGVLWLTHRLSYYLSKGLPDKGIDLCHTCDNPLCGNPDHLFEGTRQLNMIDCAIKGRGRHKLNVSAVSEIIELSKGGMSTRKIADKYGIAVRTARDTINRKSWGFVKI